MLPKRSFKPAKCKTALNLAKSRLKLMKNKKDLQLKQLRKEIAQLLETGHDQTARIRVEHVVREEKTIDAYEMIGIYCELVVTRLPIIESQKNCPLDLKEAIASLIFAAPRCGDIVELQDIRKHFTAKYGKEFVTAAAELRPDCGVSRSLIEKLSVKAPDGQTKVKILTAIAEENNIKWEPNWFKDEDPMPSVDIVKVPAAHTMEDNKIQMQPLNFEIADDLEEKHAHDKMRPGASSQSHAHSSNNLVSSSSTSRPDTRPPESSSEKMEFNQPSQTAESAFTTGRHNWNMEFTDVTSAAQAAAESAELASRAARAAAHLSRHSNVMGDSSSGPGLPNVHGQNEDNRHNVGSGLQHNQVDGNSTGSSFNQRIPKIQNQGDVSRQGSIEEGDSTTLKDDYTRYEAQHEAEKKDLKESENSRRQTSDFDLGPSTSGGEPSISRPSFFQDYETEPSENPFYEETVERKNHSSSFKSQSSAFGDEFGAFANSKYDDYKHASGAGSFGSFSRNPADQEDWHVQSANTYGDEGITLNHRVGSSILESGRKYGFDSHNDIFVGMDNRTGKNIDEKGIDTNAEVAFDESDSDDDIYTSNAAVEHNFFSPAERASKGSSLTQDKPHYERDLSESFKKSPMYSKLTEPLPVTFDNSDGESLGSEKELESGKSDHEYSTYDYRKSDTDPNQNMRYVEQGTADSFMGSNHVDKNQNRYYGSVSEHKYFDDAHASESPYNRTSSVAMSTDTESRSYYGLLDEGGSKKSLQSLRISDSGRPVSKFEYETQPRPEGGMELNLGSLPGGRRNKPHFRSSGSGLADASSPSRSTEVAPSDSFNSTEKASTRKFQVLSNQMENEKITGVHTHYDSPDDDSKVVITRKASASDGGPYKPTINENVSKLSSKDPTGYFVNDESSSEEDVPRPVLNRTSVVAGLSRRTKGSAPRAVARSDATSAVPKTVPSSSSYASEVSNSKTIDHSSLDGKASNHDIKLNSSKAEKPTATKSPNVLEASNSNEKAPTKEKPSKKPSHVHPKLPDFETFAATFQSLRRNRQ